MENAIAEVISILSQPGNQDLDLCVTRVEVLAENALSCDGIPLEVVDLLNQAVNILKRTVGWKEVMIHTKHHFCRMKEIEEGQNLQSLKISCCSLMVHYLMVRLLHLLQPESYCK